MEQLKTVHDAMSEAAQEEKKDLGPMGTHTFRIHDNIKADTKKICEMQGTTLDEYLRQCCVALVSDYKP